jgi:hypothetical protein
MSNQYFGRVRNQQPKLQIGTRSSEYAGVQLPTEGLAR